LNGKIDSFICQKNTVPIVENISIFACWELFKIVLRGRLNFFASFFRSIFIWVPNYNANAL